MLLGVLLFSFPVRVSAVCRPFRLSPLFYVLLSQDTLAVSRLHSDTTRHASHSHICHQSSLDYWGSPQGTPPPGVRMHAFGDLRHQCCGRHFSSLTPRAS